MILSIHENKYFFILIFKRMWFNILGGQSKRKKGANMIEVIKKVQQELEFHAALSIYCLLIVKVTMSFNFTINIIL